MPLSVRTSKGRGAFLLRTPVRERANDQVFVSVIVPHYRDVPSLKQALRSLQTQLHRPLEIIVVDDGSPEADFAQLMECLSDVAQCTRIAHRGPAAARNRGAALAKGNVLVFCESDAVYPPEYVGSIIAPIASCRDGSIVAANNVGRRVLEETQGWGHRYARVLYAAVDDAIRQGRRRTGAWAFDAQWFRSSAGYREDLVVGEDLELVERVISAGLKVGYGGDVPFFHREPASMYRLFRRSGRNGAAKPRSSLLALAASSLLGLLVTGVWYLFGVTAAVASLISLTAVGLLMDPTWRLAVTYCARSGWLTDVFVVSVCRLAWMAGYVCGGAAGWKQGIKAVLKK